MFTRLLLLLLALACPAWAAEATEGGAADDERTRALQRAANAVVGLEVAAVDDARSASTLGRSRQGSGVVIDPDGLVLTIGYLVLEADQVLLITDDDRRIPARLVAYDQASGFGLVKALAPLRLEPVPLGRSNGLAESQMLMMATGGEAGAVGAVRLVSRRAFSGYWEYHLDDALFTAPARPHHSGAGLFNDRGELVGIGSLFVNDAAGSERRVPGNMFVPTDLLAPILPELLARGRSRLSERAWMGLNCAQMGESVRVMRVTEDSPADVAGVEPGDRIVSLDGQAVSTVESLWKALWKGGGSERAVALEVERAGKSRTLTVHTVDRARTLRRAQGV